MKILFLGYLELGEIVAAPSKVSNEIFRRAETKYEDVKFFTYFQDGAKYSRFKKLFGKEIIEKNILMFGLFPFLFNILKYRPNVVHVTSLSVYYIIAFPLLKILSSRIYYSVHNVNKYTLDKYSTIKKSLKRKLLLSEKLSVLFATTIFVLSESEKKHLLTHYKIPNSKVKIIDNGIKPYDIKKIYKNNRDILKVITVGSVGRKEKGIEHLIRFLKNLNFSIELTICYYSKEIKKSFIQPQNVNIVWKEPLNEIELRREFIKNDFLISFAEYESFGIALLEAMNAGLLFLATDRIGLTERFNQELRQFVIPFGEWGIAKDKLNDLMSLPVKDKNILSNKIAAFSNQYTWDRVVQKIFEIYE